MTKAHTIKEGGHYHQRNRHVLWWMLLIFALPVIAAKLILSQHWYQPAVTNHGLFIDNRLYYQSLNINNPAPQRWQIAYLLPHSCLALCLQQLHLLKQTHIALGKDQPRVMPVVLMSSELNPSSQQMKADIEQMGFVVQVAANMDVALTQTSAGVSLQDYVLIDPRGQWVMRYPSVSTAGQLPKELKGLLADLRKLLTLSRVG